MIIIFAGSGASKAVDPSKYPTTIEFFEKLPDSVKNNPIFNEICSHLKTEHGNETPDIEEVLFILSELKDDFEKGKNKGTFFGWLITRNLLRSLAAHNFDTGLFPQMADDFIGRISRLIDEINEQVYSLYGTKPTPISLNKNWNNLLKHFGNMSPELPLEVFTTNYDIVLDFTLKSLDKKTFIADTGRRENDIYPTLDMSSWNGGSYSQPSNHSSKTNIKLTKLHGSVDWKYSNGNKIRVGNPDFVDDHNKHVILYPGYKDTPKTEPFVTFHNYLQSCLEKASLIVFIGFAFRDKHINFLLDRFTPNKTPIRIIDLQDDLQYMPLRNNPVQYISTGFSQKGIDEFFASCAPTKE